LNRFLISLLVAAACAAQTPSFTNPVKALLKEGKPVIGGTVQIPSAEVAAQMATMGFDFLWIEMEHGPVTLETVRNMVLATRGLKAMPFTRVPVNELWTAKRVLDAGSLGVIFPFTSTPELARQAVAACKYPPNGRRGSGPGLASFRWPAPGGYADFADNNAMVIIIIEAGGGQHRRHCLHARHRRPVHRHQRPVLLARTAGQPEPPQAPGGGTEGAGGG
jgi:2-keto-3-deoxy-L-rhamnonate aldolase RhmA